MTKNISSSTQETPLSLSPSGRRINTLPDAPQLAPSKGKKFPCLACGAQLVFEPNAQALVCSHCGQQETIPQSANEILELSYEDYLNKSQADLQVTSGAEVEVRCQSCGAIVMMAAKERTQDCPFCGVHLDSEPHAATPAIPPSAVLPFRVDQNRAKKVFQQWVNSRWFAPDDLKKLADLGKLAGLYTPYWTFDAMTHTFYSGQRGTYYWDTEQYWANVNGKNQLRTRQVRRTRWISARGQIRHWFDDILVVASQGLPREYAQELAPWDMEQLVDFKPDYLSGFRTERYQIDLQQGFSLAQELMQPTLRHLIGRDIGGDEQRIDSMQTQYSGLTFKHVLLPIWVAAYRYQNRLYRILINARTGEVQGNRPYSAFKIALAIIGGLIVLGMILYAQSGG